MKSKGAPTFRAAHEDVARGHWMNSQVNNAIVGATASQASWKLAACLALLPLDLDARLRKIAARLDMVVTQETPRRRDVSDALLGGDPLAAARAAFAQRVTLDVWDMVYAGLALSFARHGSLPRRLTVSQIPRLFALSLKDHPDAADAQQQLGKLAANLGGLPFAAGLRDLQAQLERVRPVEPWRPWAIGLNSPTDGIEDLTSIAEVKPILTILRELDPAGAHHYADELLMVAKELTMAEGQWIVDHTRIHVDLVALRRWADRELTEDFERHEDLVSVDIGPQASFEDVLKELSAGPSGRKIQPPETEADAVLQSLVRRLGDEFLTNSQFGLDFYLSKRIRHQSFIGRIRGPLEFANLITTRETEASPYHRNDFWIDQFTTVGADQREAVNAALMNCARDFDEILRDAKDRLFHIRSPEQPDGLISLDLTPEALQLVRTIALWDPEDFSSFFEVAVAALWAALDPSFARVRRFINTDLKSRITERLELARAEVRAAAGQDPAFHNFDIEFGQRSTEVQRALDDAASWFTYTRAERLRRTFTLEEAVRIGRENALRCQRGFNPVITETVHGGIEIMAPSLVIIHDTLFTALDNIRAHSGHKAPKVDVVVSHDPGRETLTVEVMSDCRPQQKMTAERKLKEIQKIIDGAAPTRRTRREGGSGILKLEAVTRQSERGRLDFGFVQGGRFRLAATYAFTFGPTAPRETGS